MRHGVRWGGAAIIVAALAVGCSRGPTGTAKEKDEEQVRAKFVALQDALRSLLKSAEGDSRPLYDLLHTDTQLDADRVAKSVSEAYAKADPATQAKFAEKLGVPAAQMGQLSGLNYLRSKFFLDKYHEIPDSKVEKISFERDKAWVHYVEPDGDHEKLELAREDTVWKVILPVPRFEMK
jgi:hypothetical protein